MKNCSFCGAENEDAAVFCEECGKSFYKKCDKCGAENKLSAKFCNKCGARFVAPNTICYTAAEKIESTWIDDNSISHDFEDGNGYIVLKDVVSSIDGEIFKDSKGLASLIIPDSVTEITIPYWTTDEYKELLPSNILGKLKEILDPHTIYYEASEKLDRQWVDKNSISHEFASGKGKIKLKYDISEIGNNAFYGCRGLTSIIMPNLVARIGTGAFQGCSKLTGTLTIPNSVTSINKNAFCGCRELSSIKIPDSVTEIGGFAFSGCRGLTTIVIPDSVTKIEDNAFSCCSGLISVTIPYSVTSIGREAFDGCSGLTSVTIPNSVTSIGEGAFSCCYGLKTVNFNATNCTIQGVSPAFSNCISLETLNIGENVTKIPARAFAANFRGLNAVYYMGTIEQWCGITFNLQPLDYAHNLYINNSLVTNLVIPDTVTEIKANAFSGATCLTSVTIGNGVTGIGERAFSGCSGLTSVTIPNSVTGIGDGAFSFCYGLTTVNFNATNCTRMGSPSDPVFSLVFSRCSSLVTLNIGKNVTNIPSYAFSGCNGLTSINIPDSVKEIRKYAFVNCSCLTSVTIGNSVAEIGDYAFSGCENLTSIALPNSIKQIGWMSFDGCNKLTTATIPDSVAGIKIPIPNGATNYYRGILPTNICDKLNEFIEPHTIYYESDNKIVSERCEMISCGIRKCEYDWVDKNSILHEFANGKGKIRLKDDVTEIGDYAFNGCSGLTSINIPYSVKSIGYAVFNGCYRLPSVTIPNSVTKIGDEAFEGCSGLTAVFYTGTIAEWCGITFNSQPLQYAHNLYIDNSHVTDLVIPNTVTEIKANAFCGATCLTSVTIGNSVASIGNSAFSGCSGLAGTLTIPNSVTSIGGFAFEYCSGLTTVTIPNSVTSIGYKAFYDCSKLRTINIPNSVKEIGDYAFYECVFPKDIKENIKKINENAFDDVCVNDYEYEPTELNDDISDAFEGDPSALWNVD